MSKNNFPKLHNAMWPGLVGKGSPGAEPAIDLDTMLEFTARAEVDGARFDGVDLFLFEPHLSIDADEDTLKRLADKIAARGFVVGSVVAPVWPPTGGGSAMGSEEERKRFVEQVRKACRIAARLRQLGIRPYGVVRIDSACGVADWVKDPETNQARIAGTFRQACDVAEDFGERLAAEGEICWGGMHSWRRMVDLLQRVNRPRTLGFQADMAHTLLYVLGYNAPEDGLLPSSWDWSDPARLDAALCTLTRELRPWTIDFHVAQNDATVHGSGTHDKTGHHCLPNDPQGKLDIVKHAGFWLRDEEGKLTRNFRHLCWDGCMFPNAVMHQPETWNNILRIMIAVRNAHGWQEGPTVEPKPTPPRPVTLSRRKSLKKARPAKLAARAKPKTKAATEARKRKSVPARRTAPKRRSKAKAAPRTKQVTRPARKAPAKKGRGRTGK